jgi:hypothetical protein
MCAQHLDEVTHSSLPNPCFNTSYEGHYIMCETVRVQDATIKDVIGNWGGFIGKTTLVQNGPYS